MKRGFAFIAALCAIAAVTQSSVAIAQEKLGERPALVPLKVDLVISRTSGAKKISSMPYTLWVTANDREPNSRTSLRMGVEVPVPTTVIAKDAPPATSYSYRPVGTNIDCSAMTVSGFFRLAVTLSDSSIQFDAKDTASSQVMPTRLAGAPAFRNFTSNFVLLLRDGQSATYTSATDPISGETLKVDVTLAVLK